jgi:hypothetical protein
LDRWDQSDKSTIMWEIIVDFGWSICMKTSATFRCIPNCPKNRHENQNILRGNNTKQQLHEHLLHKPQFLGLFSENHKFRTNYEHKTQISWCSPFNTKTDRMTQVRHNILTSCCWIFGVSSNWLTATLDQNMYMLALLWSHLSALFHRCLSSRSVSIDITSMHGAAIAALASKQWF